jgi:hypothetical protein
MYIDNDLTNEEREIQKKLREVAREARDKGKWVKIGYRKRQINGGWLRWEREEKLKKNFLEEGKKKRRRPGEKRFWSSPIRWIQR